jgi:hypothetical protein
MKKTIWYLRLLCIACAVFVLGCNKETRSDFDKLSELTQEVISKPTIQEMRQGQFMLSAKERDALWKTKLDFILSNKKETFTIEQRQIVTQLKSFLNKHGMEALLKNPHIGLEFMDKNLPFFSKHFNKEQLNILIESPYLNSSLTISTINEKQIASMVEAVGGYCTCIYDMGCPGSGNFCEQTGCYVDNDEEMCGVFGTSSCKKRCSDLQPSRS